MLVRTLHELREAGRSTPVTLALLIGANLIPLVGVLLFDWDVASVLILYWLENAIVGIVNVPKILLTTRNPLVREGLPEAAFRAFFFVIHYGVFWVGHGLFVVALTGARLSGANFDLFGAPRLALSEPGLLLAAAGLLAGHVAAFVTGYLREREYLRVTPAQQQFQPYPRMIVLHLTIIFGGIAVLALGQPIALVALLVALKTIADVGLFVAERLRRRRAPADAVSVT